MTEPRLIQIYLLDGTLEGVKIVELSQSSIKAFFIPRVKLADIQTRSDIKQPSIYLLIGIDAETNNTAVYVGESESFYSRVKNHEQSKSFWDIAVAFVSTNNTLEKGDVKYLESLLIEEIRDVSVLNKSEPAKNTIHEFKLHSLRRVVNDIKLIVGSFGWPMFIPDEDEVDGWICDNKGLRAIGDFQGDKFVVKAGSHITKNFAPSWAKSFPKSLLERNEIIMRHGKDLGDRVELASDVVFRSANHAGGFVTGRSLNAWTTWKNQYGQTMDEVMRREKND